MRLHDRYLLRELLTPLSFCVGGFVLFWIPLFFKGQLDLIHEKKLGFSETIAYCAASLPGLFVVILPIILLLALLYALTQHARHNEITALRAAGVSLWRVAAPYFAVGLLATALYYALGEVVVPVCDRWTDQILERHGEPQADPKEPSSQAQHGFWNSRANRSWLFWGDYDTVNNAMHSPTVTWTLADGSWRAIHASMAVLTNGVWTFYDVRLYSQAGRHGDLVPSGATNALPMPEFDETPEHIRLLLQFADTQTAGAQAAHASGSSDIPLPQLWEFLRNNPGLRPETMRSLQTQFYGRIATPWVCFVVVLVAIPFGAQTGRRNLFVGVAGSIFIGFLYFILQKVSLALGVNGQLPGWLAAWLPNTIFAVTGIALTLRVR